MWDCIADICFAEDQSCYSFVQGPPGAPGMTGPTGKPGKNGDTGVPVWNLLVFLNINGTDTKSLNWSTKKRKEKSL